MQPFKEYFEIGVRVLMLFVSIYWLMVMNEINEVNQERETLNHEYKVQIDRLKNTVDDYRNSLSIVQGLIEDLNSGNYQ